MKIGNVEIKNNLILAPMAGVTDVGFRAVCKKYGVGATVTEMVSSKGLFHDSEKTATLLETYPSEDIKIVQLFGHEPEIFKSVINSPLLDKFDIIDLNMGCPAPKIVKNGDGSALMKDLPLASEIIKTCVKYSNKPITVKFRLGWDEDSINCVEFARMCETSGASAITIHGRTRKQFYSGKADYQKISEVVKSVNIPVIANGDVDCKQSYEEILKTGCDGVMIGRGALGRPELFAELLQNGKKFNKLDIILEHTNILKQYKGEKFTILNMRKHYAWYLKGVTKVKEYRNEINAEDNFDKLIEILKKAFKEE